MAQPNLEFFTNRGLLLKAEATTGVDPSPTPTADSFEILEGTSGTQVDTNDRVKDRAFLTNNPFTVSNKRAFIEGNVEIHPPENAGAATENGSPIEPALLPAAMAKVLDAVAFTTTYNPISTGIPSVWAAFYHAGTLREINSARGNLTGLKMEIGTVFQSGIRIEGLYNEIDEAALPTFNFSRFFEPDVSEHNNSVSSVTVWGKDGVKTVDALTLWSKLLSVDFGNQLTTKEYTELKQTGINDRTGTFTARFARTAKADFDPWATRDAGLTVQFEYQLKQADGRYSKLIARGQIEEVNEVDIDGDYGIEVTGRCIASDSGGDDYLIEFGFHALTIAGTPDDGAETVAYSFTPTAAGPQTGPLTWAITSGSLPSALTLDPATGEISGIPDAATAGDYPITLQVTDSAGTPAVATRNYVITITA